MRKLFKYLSIYWRTVLLIILLLLVQAFCDLSLPQYTSDIVNVGIQQGGIDEKVPEKISKEDMEQLFLFLSEEDQKKVLADYEEEKDRYVLAKEVRTDSKKIDSLSDIMGEPMMMAYAFSSDTEMTKELTKQLMASMPAGMASENASAMDIISMLPADKRQELVKQMEEQFAKMPDTMVSQASVYFIQKAYKDLGEDLDGLQYHYLLVTGGKMLALALLGMAVSVLVGLLAARTAASLGRDIRGRVFRNVVGFSNGEFDKFSTASLITRSTNDIQQMQLLTVLLLRMVLYAPLLGIGGVLKVVKTNVDMTWILGVAVALVVMVVIVLFTVVMPRFRILQTLVDKLNLVAREILTGLPVIRAFSTEKYEEERFDRANVDLTKTNLFVNRAMTFMMPMMMLIMNGVSVLIVWVGAHGIDEGQMQVGDMMAFIQYSMQIIMAFLMICMVSIMLPRAAVSANRVDEVLTSKTAIHDAKDPQQLPESGKGVVAFDHVCFRYPGAAEDVLHDITFTATPGETTAFIGSTGSGKTTLINLIPRFYDVTGGKITVDGCDVRGIAQHDLRDKIGYVPQRGVLFSGTISSNIKYSNPELSDAEMKKAAEVAQAIEFIETKEDGYEDHIAQGGDNVSGGQKQRLSIARAIAKKPDIYIFDDSFSALDFKTDVALRRALKAYTADSTVLIVAQRISTIMNAEQIIVLDEGGVAGKGTHEELLKSCEVYRQIALSQLSEEELAGYGTTEKGGEQA